MTYFTNTTKIHKEKEYFNFGCFSFFSRHQTIFMESKKLTGTASSDVGYMWFVNVYPEKRDRVESEYVVLFNADKTKSVTVAVRIDQNLSVNVELGAAELATLQVIPSYWGAKKEN